MPFEADKRLIAAEVLGQSDWLVGIERVRAFGRYLHETGHNEVPNQEFWGPQPPEAIIIATCSNRKYRNLIELFELLQTPAEDINRDKGDLLKFEYHRYPHHYLRNLKETYPNMNGAFQGMGFVAFYYGVPVYVESTEGEVHVPASQREVRPSIAQQAQDKATWLIGDRYRDQNVLILGADTEDAAMHADQPEILDFRGKLAGEPGFPVRKKTALRLKKTTIVPRSAWGEVGPGPRSPLNNIIRPHQKYEHDFLEQVDTWLKTAYLPQFEHIYSLLSSTAIVGVDAVREKQGGQLTFRQSVARIMQGITPAEFGELVQQQADWHAALAGIAQLAYLGDVSDSEELHDNEAINQEKLRQKITADESLYAWYSQLEPEHQQFAGMMLMCQFTGVPIASIFQVLEQLAHDRRWLATAQAQPATATRFQYRKTHSIS